MIPCRISDAARGPGKSRRRSHVSFFIVTDVGRKSGRIKHERRAGANEAVPGNQLPVTSPHRHLLRTWPICGSPTAGMEAVFASSGLFTIAFVAATGSGRRRRVDSCGRGSSRVVLELHHSCRDRQDRTLHCTRRRNRRVGIAMWRGRATRQPQWKEGNH